ncbi:MAG: signal recognition particle-docking protein FtsY [Bacilli bacterium]|nr:signal recognition particle-docking protein FtsY [Bacilli bacterium]
MGLFQKFKDMFSSKKQREEELEEILEQEESNEDIEEEIDKVEETPEEELEEIEETPEEESVEETNEDASNEEEDNEKEITEEEHEEVEEEPETVKEESKKEKKKKGFFGFKLTEKDKDLLVYDKGLEKSRKEFVSELSLLGKKFTRVNEEYYEELEQLLISADIGINTVFKFMDRLRDRVKHENITDTNYLTEVIVDELLMIYVEGSSLTDKINMAESGPTVILMVGVNGVGKTTTIGKLAHKYIKEGKKVMLIAGDTFRAGAVPQLEEWANRTGAEFFGKENSDPAGVIFDGLVKAKELNVDIVLIDTAGRLQNKVNLMNELEKINKVIGRHVPNAPHETLLIIDATTGQNGISQAESFKEITNVTGIVLTKLDGTAKGGIVLAIKENVGIPVKFIGLGEQMEDLRTFDIEDYIYGLFKDMM